MAQSCRWRFDAVLRGPSPFVGEDDDPNHGHFRVSMGIFVPPFGDTHTHILLLPFAHFGDSIHHYWVPLLDTNEDKKPDSLIV